MVREKGRDGKQGEKGREGKREREKRERKIGQMYVALSRVRQPTNLKIAAMEDYVQNIVFKDVLI